MPMLALLSREVEGTALRNLGNRAVSKLQMVPTPTGGFWKMRGLY
jgi:hypothetical protein